MAPDTPRILIVDDEEAILETMSFTFMDAYDVYTSTDARKALDLFDEKGPIAVVITDQRMPNMTGVEFLSHVCERWPETTRIMLTGFADMDATIQAINDGHVYAYVNKPWDQDDLKQLVARAVEHNRLAVDNARLMGELQSTNLFLEAVMDRLATGALAVDAQGVVRASNRPACDYLRLQADPRGQALQALLAEIGVEELGSTIMQLVDEGQGAFEDVELRVGDSAARLRVSAQRLQDGEDAMGSVILFKEISHEPLGRRFEEIVASVAQQEGALRPRLEEAVKELGSLGEALQQAGVSSPSMLELSERTTRTQTAIQNWLDVDELLSREEFPDAQLLNDRMRLAAQRWPYPDELPERVRALAERVDRYYDSGENVREPTL